MTPWVADVGVCRKGGLFLADKSAALFEGGVDE